MEILKAIDLVLQNAIVRWLLLAATVAAIATATWCKIQIGTVRLQRDAAQGQAATYQAHLQVQNEAIVQLNNEFKIQQQRMTDASTKADWIKKDAEAWRKKALGTPLTGDCDQMVNQVIEAVQK